MLFRKNLILSSAKLCIFFLGTRISPLPPPSLPLLVRVWLPWGLMEDFMEFDELPLMPPVDNVAKTGKSSLGCAGGAGGVWWVQRSPV